MKQGIGWPVTTRWPLSLMEGEMAEVSEITQCAYCGADVPEEISALIHHANTCESRPKDQQVITVPDGMMTWCFNCGEACLKLSSSTLCQDCFDWPETVLENALDADIVG